MSSSMSILGPLLCNIYINDIFAFVDEAFVSNYAGNTELYFFKKATSLTKKKKFMYITKWFLDDYMVLNSGKCYYMTFGLRTTKMSLFLKMKQLFLLQKSM